ncbi:MAG: tRNA pseudouridine(55) synthase TruB [Parachlamydiaceae bacterium]|nr:tRNA pseudouridine(55) synthase TruB [Parachlamydiaceae bacterium]
MSQSPLKTCEGILPINKPVGKMSFSLISRLRRILNIQKIGHAGTLDPFASGVMILLIGRNYTRLSDRFLEADKQYRATLKFGVTTDSFDCDGQIIKESDFIPSLSDLEVAITHFQGEVEQIPPMFSAKKVNGKKLYELARQGKTVERAPAKVRMETTLLHYEYPYATLSVTCSKGTYIRSIAHDIGERLGCGAHLIQLERTRSGTFLLDDCLDGSILYEPTTDLELVRSKILTNLPYENCA